MPPRIRAALQPSNMASQGESILDLQENMGQTQATMAIPGLVAAKEKSATAAPKAQPAAGKEEKSATAAPKAQPTTGKEEKSAIAAPKGQLDATEGGPKTSQLRSPRQGARHR